MEDGQRLPARSASKGCPCWRCGLVKKCVLRLHQSLEGLSVRDLLRPAEVVADLGGRIESEALEDGGEHVADRGPLVAGNVHTVSAGCAEDSAALDGAAAQH